ncbi:ABC transporter permease [Thalassotalea marina]|uniref:ABC transporter permease n=1 Tax=Thalassotalea marina TaxID=1673741 RepID=A0A919BDK3_9GAMM|nr:ABC transporter permease [Thalassotalea marina]GHF84334.1 ABC transporter permease [Thalassotalea marina]
MFNLPFVYDVVLHVLESLRVNALKSSLIIVSVGIGVMALVLGLTFSQTLSRSLVWQFENLGSNTLTVSSYLPLSEQLKGNKAIINHGEYEMIKNAVSKQTANVTPIISINQAVVRFQDKSIQPSAIGTTFSYMKMRSRFVEKGRFINDADNSQRRRSVVIGKTVAEDLSLGEAVGQYITINNEWFIVVGVLAEKGNLLGIDLDELIIMPYQTSQSLLGNGVEQDVLIQMNVNDVSSVASLRNHIVQLLREQHNLAQYQENDFKVETTDELLSTFNSVLKIVSITLICVVGLSLIVASVGMTNIFLLSINERTNEIGLMMAIGAGRKFISSLFIIESSVLTTIGGVVGLFFGYLLALFASLALPEKYVIEFPVSMGIYTVTFCFLLGLLVSLLPASKACTLSPSCALSK